MRTFVLLIMGAAAIGAAAQPLDLPCTDANGRPVSGTAFKVIRADFEGELMSAPAVSGRCSMALEPGVYLVKAEAPGQRSAPQRIRWPSAKPVRALRLVSLKGRNAERRQTLQALVDADQAVRNALRAAEAAGDKSRAERLGHAMQAVDAVNEKRLRGLLASGGFPRAADVGYEGVNAAWLLLQHSYGMLAQQLPAMRAAADAGELGRDSLALSEDRVRMWAGKPQRYGSQLSTGKDGKLAVYPLESPEQVEAWREAMDLEPLADYLKRFER